ncbi:MAG: glycosyltransferase, partial [Methanothrix sp.]|nr:glycosyltransferase [Methanothrix sp.]
MDIHEQRRLRVLFLASWYPNKEHSVSGIFVKRHALAASQYCDVAVLHVHLGSIDRSIDVAEDNGIIEVRVYQKMSTNPNRLIRDLSNQGAQYLGYLRCALKGYELINKMFGKPDLVHCNVILYAGFFALYLKLTKGIPYIITEHWAGYLKEDGTFNKKSFLGRGLIRSIGKNAKAITTVSGKLRDEMIACGITNCYSVIPNVVNVAEMKCSREKAGMKQILHVSLLKDDIKNISGIIEAVKELSLKRKDFLLHIIGDGNDKEKLEGLARKYSLLNKMIFFEGMVNTNDVSKFFYASDFFVLNSNFETFSVVTAEALACGKPVIATRCGGPEEFVKDNCGVLIETRDKNGLVKAMDHMLDNFSTYNSKEIRDYAKSRFGCDSVGKKFFDLYVSVIDSSELLSLALISIAFFAS